MGRNDPVFTPVTFGDKTVKTREPQKEVIGNEEEIDNFISKIDLEIQKILSGGSDLTNRAIHLEKGTCPAISVFEAFKREKSKVHLENFIELTKQDFGGVVADQFKKWSRRCFTETKTAPIVKTNRRPFDIELQQSLYDVFRVYEIGLSQAQVDRINKAATKIAALIELEMTSRLLKLQAAVVDAFKKIK